MKEFASQVTAVATMVLNDEIEVETARVYAAHARVVAQTLSAETTRSRFVKEAPDMGLDDEVFEPPEGLIAGDAPE